MSTIRRRLARAVNWTKRRIGLPAKLVEHTDLSVLVLDDTYYFITRIRNLTGNEVFLDAKISMVGDDGPLSFENLYELSLLTSEQCFNFHKYEKLPRLNERIRIAPYAYVDIELAEFRKGDKGFLVAHRYGTAGVLTEKVTMRVGVVGAGLPDRFSVHFEKFSDPERIRVRQGRGLNRLEQYVDCDLNASAEKQEPKDDTKEEVEAPLLLTNEATAT